MRERSEEEKKYQPKPGRHVTSVKKYTASGRDAATPLYELLKERTKEQSISHQTMPTFEEHVEFMLKPGYRVWNLILDGETVVGSVYLTARNEIGIAIFKAHQRKGYATFAFNNTRKVWGHMLNGKGLRVAPQFIANINPQNEASIKFFESLGFVHIQNTYRYEPLT